jgi:GNAT superfamily N-acetyltransferase
MTKNFFILLIFFSLNKYEAASADFTGVSCTVGDQFRRKESTAYLRCYDARDYEDKEISLRSFEIIPHDGEFKGKVVGKIGTKFSLAEKRVEIGALDVYPEYQRNGYGESSLRIVLGIYRSQKNINLEFNHFFLTVGLGRDRTAARKLYAKVGFVEPIDLSEEEKKSLKAIGYCYLTQDR